MTDVGRITAADAASIPGELVARAVKAERRALLLGERADSKAHWLSSDGTIRDSGADALASLARDVAFLLRAAAKSPSVGTDGPQSGPGVIPKTGAQP